MLAERPVVEHKWTFDNPDDFRIFDYLREAFLRVCQMGWAIVDLLFCSLLTSLAWFLCAIRCSSTKLLHDSAPNPEQPKKGSPPAANIDSESGRIDNNVSANGEEAEEPTRADSEASSVGDPTTDNETKNTFLHSQKMRLGN